MNETFYDILPTGVHIVLRKTPSEVVYVGILVGAGTRYEEEQYNGLAHYIEHCVFKGTYYRSARNIINTVEEVGGEINAYTTKEETAYYVAVPRAHWKKAASLLSEMVLYPNFPYAEIEKEKAVIEDEIESYEDSPSELIYDDFEALLFEGSKLALPILGTKKTVERIARSKGKVAKEWMRRYYRLDRMVFFVEGDVEMASVRNWAERMFGEMAPDPQCTWRSEAPVCTAGAERVYKRHTHQSHVMIGGKAFTLYDERQPGLYLLNNILGGGSLNSRLNLSLREDAGLVYTIESQQNPLSDTGYWNIYFASDDEDRERCLELVRKELRRLREEKLSRYQLDKALRQLYGQMAISAENRENRFLAMGKQVLYYGEAPTWQETFERVKRFTPEQLQEIAREVYDESQIVTLIYA